MAKKKQEIVEINPELMSRGDRKRAEKLRKKQEAQERARIQRAQQKKKITKQETAKTLQATIPYRKAYSNGIIETAKGIYTKSYLLKDVNYQAAKLEAQHTMFQKYAELLNTFDASMTFQISVNNRNIDIEQFKENTLIELQEDGLNVYRNEYNDMLVDKMAEGKNNMVRDKYLTVSTPAESYKAACNIFSRLDTEITSATKKIGGSEATPLSTLERLEIIHNLLNIGKENEFEANKEDPEMWLRNLTMRGLDTKDIVVPSGIEFQKNHMVIGDKYARALYLKELPNFMPDVIISELTDCDHNMITSMDIAIVPQDKAIKIVKSQMVNIGANIVDRQKKAVKSGYDPSLTSPDLMKAQEEANELLDQLTTKDQKMFQMTLVIMHFADSLDKLDKDTASIQAVGRKYSCEIKSLFSQQELGFKSVLPVCYNQLLLKRTLTTASTAVFMPFTSQELSHKHGHYFGLNAISRNMILFNRESCKNGNGFILGTPGSGKSFTGKQSMVNIILGTNDDIIIIDPENEYSPLIELLGGEVISIDAGGANHINPFDMDAAYAGEKGKNPLVLKTDFIISLCDTVGGGYAGLTPSQMSIIDRCVRAVYSEYLASEYIDENGEKCYDASKTPTLLEFQQLLASQRDREAKEIALALELYTSGSLDNFAHKTNVDVNNRFLAYNLRDVGDNMMNMAMLTVTNTIWNRILRNHRLGKKTWVFVDEAHLLFANRTSATFMKTLYKRSRKFNGYITSITQNVTDILDNPICKTMIGNSEFLILLNQSADDRDRLAEQLSLSETQLDFITSANPGEGLLINSPTIIPFINKFPQDTQLYRAMTTKPSDIAKYKAEKAAVELEEEDDVDEE